MLFFFFFIIDSYFLIPAVITQLFNPIVELAIAIAIGMPTKEAKAEMERHPVIIELQ